MPNNPTPTPTELARLLEAASEFPLPWHLTEGGIVFADNYPNRVWFGSLADKDANALAVAAVNALPAHLAAIASLQSEIEGLREELEWISMFAKVRSEDDSKTFARVNRGALRNISERAARAALTKDTNHD